VKFGAIGIKLGVTGLLVCLLLTHVDLGAAGALLRSTRGLSALALAVAVLLAQAVVAAIRTDWIMQLLGARCPVGRSFAVWMVGLVVSQTLLTFIAGDAARIWQLVPRGYSSRVASSAIVLERALGLTVLLAMVLACEPSLLDRTSPGAVRTGLLVLGALCAGGIVAFFASAFLGELKRLLPERLRDHRLVGVALDVASAARHLTRSWKLASAIVVSSALMHLGNVLAIFVLARAAGIGIDFTATTVVALPTMLIALMPIALAGWGVREGSMVVGYGLFGVAPSAALATSIAFGLAMVIVSLPGFFFIRVAKPERAAAPV
jgi:uncharacterized membrane protein YbhN (UPF0104 family)